VNDLTVLAARIGDLEQAAHELGDAASDATEAEHLHGDASPQYRDRYRVYMNWRDIVRETANALRAQLGIAERRPDVEAYTPTYEP